MIYLLDTDTFTQAYYGKFGLRERFAKQRLTDPVGIPSVTRLEDLEGRIAGVLTAADGAGLARAVEWLRLSEEYLATFGIAPFTEEAGKVFDRLLTDKMRRKIGRADLLIACIALAHDATLVTRNNRDFALIPGLKLENWAD